MDADRKLSDADVVAIRVAAVERGEQRIALAERYGVTLSYVGRIVRGEQRVAAGGPTAYRPDGRPPRDHYAPSYSGVDLDSLPDSIALARDAGLPVILDVDRPLPVHAQRLMDTLGVEVRVSSQSVRGRGMGAYTEDVAGRQPFEANLIDFRHSVVQAHKRADAGDESLEICAYCMCEVDVDPQPHRPGCAGIGGARATSSPVLAGLDPLSHSPAPKPSVVLGSARNGLDALARMDDGLPQEPELDLDVDEPDGEVLEEREPEVPVEPTSVLPTEERPEVAPSRSSSTARWTREQILDAIRRWAADHDGKPPTRRDWHQEGDGHPNDYIVRNTLGSTWAEAIEQAGFAKSTRGSRLGSKHATPQARPVRLWTRETIIEAIQAWAAEHGSPPKASDWERKSDGYPQSGSVLLHFGSWNAGIEAAGFAPRPRGRVPKTDAGESRALAEPGPERLGQDDPGSAGARDETDAARGEEASDETLIAATGAETPASPSASPNADGLVLGLTLEQLVAAGHAIEAISSRLHHLEKPERRVVWEFIRPLIEAALDA